MLIWGTRWLANAPDTQLLFMLKPVAFLIGLCCDKVFVFQPGVGFYEPGGVVISKACGGLGFLLIHFAMLVFSFIDSFAKTAAKLMSFVLFLLLSYLVAILVNVSRIIGLVYLIKTDILGGMVSRLFIHKAGGLLFYLFFLTASYMGMSYWQFRRKAGKKDEQGL